MFLKKIGLATAGVALAAFGFVAAAQAAGTNVNVFNGSSGALATDVTAFDWSETGSGVAIGVGPFGTPLTAGQTFTFDYQSFLTAFTTANPVTPTLVNSGAGGTLTGNQYQFSAAASFTEQVFSISGAAPFTTAVFVNADQNGTFSIFYDDSTTSGTTTNVAAGTGFTDGIEVARFTILSAISAFTTTGVSSGIGTASIHTTLSLAADFVNSDYIQGIDGKVFDMEFTSNQQFGIGAVGAGTSNTSHFFSGPGGSPIYTPYTVDNSCSGANTCDIVFKADGSSTFSIPEPQTLLLFGIGLLMLGFVARRSTTRAH
jgi:hypothetical protein